MSELDSRKSEKVIGGIAFENRVKKAIAFSDSSDDLFTSLEIMFRREQEIQDSGGKFRNIRVFASLITKIGGFYCFCHSGR